MDDGYGTIPDFVSVPSEAGTALGQDSSGWLTNLLTTGIGAYVAVNDAKQTTAQQKLKAQLAVPSPMLQAQPAFGGSSGISMNTILIGAGIMGLGLVLIFALKK